MPVALKEKKKLDEILNFKREETVKYATTKRATLCYIFKDSNVLMQMKKSGKFGGGHWNAPGGKVKENETPEIAAIREVKEETGLEVRGLRLMGRLFFVFEKEEEYNQEVYVFITRTFSGNQRSGEEGELYWFEKNKIPMDMLWPSDIYWLPMLLDGKNFTGHFFYDKYKDVKITKYYIKEGLQE